MTGRRRAKRDGNPTAQLLALRSIALLGGRVQSTTGLLANLTTPRGAGTDVTLLALFLAEPAIGS